MEEEAAEKLGVHRHHFGEDRLWVPMLQVCIGCPSLWKEVGAVCLSERMWLTYMKHVPVESGEAQTIEQVWKEYFADPLQWWDNRVDKVSLGLSLGLPVSWCQKVAKKQWGGYLLMVGCGAYRWIPNHLTLNTRWQRKRFG
jgi:hypothetical protein